jgi:hypothetical protein
MAMTIIDDRDSVLKVALDNGDYRILNEIVEKWKFKDRESALRYALALLDLSERGNLFKKDKDRNDISLEPSDQLIEK